MIESHAFSLLYQFLNALNRRRIPKMNYTANGTECILEYQGRFYRVLVEDIGNYQPTEEMACAG